MGEAREKDEKRWSRWAYQKTAQSLKWSRAGWKHPFLSRCETRIFCINLATLWLLKWLPLFHNENSSYSVTHYMKGRRKGMQDFFSFLIRSETLNPWRNLCLSLSFSMEKMNRIEEQSKRLRSLKIFVFISILLNGKKMNRIQEQSKRLRSPKIKAQESWTLCGKGKFYFPHVFMSVWEGSNEEAANPVLEKKPRQPVEAL